MHDLSLITLLATAFTAALFFGLLTQWLKLSPIVGYLLAGVMIGPYTPGLVADVSLVQQLAELGVILLMFGVGLHFHVKELLAVKHIAVPGAIFQSFVATILAIAVYTQFGLSVRASAVIGMAMAVASTVVLMRVLMDANALDSHQGHVAVGWLIVEDIFTVVLLVLIPALGNATSPEGSHGAAPEGMPIWLSLVTAVTKLGALTLVVLWGGSRLVPWLLLRVARLRSKELFTLTVLVLSIAIASGSYFLFGASMALGAFLAGMVVGQSSVSHQAGADALPLRDAFSVLFFVSVGMLFDPSFIVKEPFKLLAALGIILIAKPAAALVIVSLLGQSGRTALTVALGLAQIGEFSFILSDLAREHGLMPEAGHNLLVASAIISITLNPLLFRNLPGIERWLRARPRAWSLLNGRAEKNAARLNATTGNLGQRPPGTEQRLAVVIGYGPVGRSVHRLLRDAGIPSVIIDTNMDTISDLRQHGQAAIFGDASSLSILEQAGVPRASHVVLTIPNVADRAAIVTAVRALNGRARLFVRARYLGEREELERSGATAAVFEEAEAAVGLARLVLMDSGMRGEAAAQKVRELRLHLIIENMSNIRIQRVRSIMVPWTRVRHLRNSDSKAAVLAQIAQERYSRWPVVDTQTRRAIGYLLTKDLISQAGGEDNWLTFLRPLPAIGPEDDIESTLMRMQSDGATIYVVEENSTPVGLVTFEDILEQVVGRIEDEYPRDSESTLCQAIKSGVVRLHLSAATHSDAIAELAAAIAIDRLPANVTIEQVIERALAREEEISTDLGIGVAIPHVRVNELRDAMLIVGRSDQGIVFSPASAQPVRLIFFLITAAEQPDEQLALLGHLAKLIGNDATREQLLQASRASDVTDILCRRTSDQPL